MSKLSRWVLHQLTDTKRQHPIGAAISLLLFCCTKVRLNSIVTREAKWILYADIQRTQSRSPLSEHPKTTEKPALYPKKVMLPVWLQRNGTLLVELLAPSISITP